MRTQETVGFWRQTAVLLPLIAALAGCGSGQPTAHVQAKPPLRVAPAPAAAIPTALPAAPTPIKLASFSRTVDAAGQPTGPSQIFRASSDRSVFLAMQMAPLPAGAKVRYLRTESGRYVDSGSLRLQPKAVWVDFKWAAPPGATLTPGSYIVRVYVNDVRAWEGAYEVL